LYGSIKWSARTQQYAIYNGRRSTHPLSHLPREALDARRRAANCWTCRRCHYLLGNAIGFLFQRIITRPDRKLSL
jgi:hypothetical protein